MNINEFVKDFLDKSNAYDTKNYLDKWNENAVLDDPSVGKVFEGHLGIQNYFESYFIGEKTQTRLVKLEISTNDEAHLEVEFTVNFQKE